MYVPKYFLDREDDGDNEYVAKKCKGTRNTIEKLKRHWMRKYKK